MTEPTPAQSQPVPFDPHATSMGDEVAPEVYEELFAMRRSIDNFDAALVHILAERFQATKRVGLLKATICPRATPAVRKPKLLVCAPWRRNPVWTLSLPRSS